MDAFNPVEWRELSAGKLATARTRRATNRPLACGMRPAPLSAVRASRCLRSLTRWASFLAPNYSTHVPSNFRRNSHKTNERGTCQVTHNWGCVRPHISWGTSGQFDRSALVHSEHNPLRRRRDVVPITKPHFPSAKMITIARQRKTIVEEPCV